MNEEARRRIKTSFCARQKWVLDSQVSNCFKCDEKFNPLFRRKHHCRFCGQIFCHKCSNYFFDGKDLGDHEKHVRMCNACYQKCWKYIAQHDQQYMQFRKSMDDQEENARISDAVSSLKSIKNCTDTEKDKTTQIQQLVSEYNDEQLKQLQKLEKDAHKKFKILLQMIMKEKNIPLKHFLQICQVTKAVVERNKANALITNNMDICKNIKIKCFRSEEFSIQYLVNNIRLTGCVLVKKNYQNKKISESYQNINCILIYGGLESSDLVGGDKEASFEEIVNNRTKEMAKVISYCQRLGISLIFLQKSIEKECESKFLQAGIIVIPKIKIDHIVKLKIALRIEKIVESVHQLYSFTKEEIVGRIQQLTTQSFVSMKDDGKIKKFYAVNSVKDELGMTIFIFGDERETMMKIREELPLIITKMKQIQQKTHQILLDSQLLDSMINTDGSTKFSVEKQEIFFRKSDSEGQFLDTLSAIHQKYLSYKHITYTISNPESYFDINKTNLQEYYNNRPYIFRTKWDQFTQICGQIQDHHRLFYSDDDTPLGAYLLNRILSMNKKCGICKKMHSSHIDFYYSTDRFVKIWTESLVHFEGMEDEEEAVGVKEEFEDLDSIFSELQKQQEKGKIECFIQCGKCGQALTNRVMLSRQNLQCSILIFLNHFFKSATESLIRLDNTKPKKGHNQTCIHIDKNRVFAMGKKFVKISFGNYILNRVHQLTKSSMQTFLQKQQKNYCNHYCRQQNITINKIIQYLLEQIKKIADNSTSKISKYQKIIQNTKSSFIHAKKNIITSTSSTVRLSQIQCIDMILPGLIEQLKKINNVSALLLNHKKSNNLFQCQCIYYVIVSLLNKNYLVLMEFKKLIKKRQLEMKFQMSDFYQDCCIGEQDQDDGTDYCKDASIGEEYYDSESEVTKGEYLSITDGFYKNDKGGYLLQQSNGPPLIHKGSRKSAYSKRSQKATQQQAIKTFKQVSSALRVQHGYLSYVPAFANQPQTLIASALNSRIYKECIEDLARANEKQLVININKYLENQLSIDNQELKKLETSIGIHQRMFDMNSKVKKNYGSVNYQITILCPHQFECWRRKKNINLQLFIESVGGAQPWMASGGKSRSSFMRSFNDLLVIKKINPKQFATLKKILPKYTSLMCDENSLLVPIFGAFIITKNSKPDYYIVMQNIFFGMSNWYLYDIKGSITKRFTKFPIIPLDANFMLDRNSEPIFCKQHVLKNLSKSIQFLAENNIVDYSLILAIQIQNKDDYYMDGNRFNLGIVDYLRDYGTIQKFQRTLKGQQATVQKPENYKDRINRNLRRYFTQILL